MTKEDQLNLLYEIQTKMRIIQESGLWEPLHDAKLKVIKLIQELEGKCTVCGHQKQQPQQWGGEVMAKIAHCSLKMIGNYRYNHDGKRLNDPINLEVIERIAKDREAYYPDNDGIAVIAFYRDGKQVHTWRFNNDKQRDEEFERITSPKNPEEGR